MVPRTLSEGRKVAGYEICSPLRSVCLFSLSKQIKLVNKDISPLSKTPSPKPHSAPLRLDVMLTDFVFRETVNYFNQNTPEGT